ncbi:hypothetical protein ACFY2E_09800 [Nonomuraea jabiensis]|uniref:hypothetical protein n=1 Tax=Nonomuraea jabiensis TaxID=882448 RepID=UPI0036769A4C
MERDLGVRLFDRDRRSVSLTPAGAALLSHATALLERADGLRHRARRLSGSEPVRLGYVNWLPPDLAARTGAAAQVHVDTWVAPSHTQAARVADGGLDLAVCWVRGDDLARLSLNARLIGADRPYAVATGADAGPVPARAQLAQGPARPAAAGSRPAGGRRAGGLLDVVPGVAAGRGSRVGPRGGGGAARRPRLRGPRALRLAAQELSPPTLTEGRTGL